MHKITSLELLRTPETDFMSLSFLQKVILELKCTKHFFRASKNTNSVLVQLSKLRECEATDAQKLLLSQKSC